ncbi:MAG: SRPBCC family protein [Actinomycetota bacterium]|nr:SRPBCC family protein [Actinomycetota bacterium]
MAQQEYEQSQAIDAPPGEVFAWLSDVGNLPKYLPPVVDSSVEGPSAEGVPGRRIRTTLEYPGEGEGTFDAEGYLAVDERERRMEWGAEEGRDYSGWLTVGNHGESGSEVVVHLSFGERSAGRDIEARSPEGRDPLAEDISATLESIRGQIEEGSDKLEAPPPPEGAEPQLEENPAVVDQDPSPEPPRR